MIERFDIVYDASIDSLAIKKLDSGQYVKYSEYQAMENEARDCLAFSVWLISRQESFAIFSKEQISQYIFEQFQIFRKQAKHEF
jgi:hypothetical protein